MQNFSARTHIEMDRACFKVTDGLCWSKKDTKAGSDYHLHRPWRFLGALIPWNSSSQIKKSGQADFFSSATAFPDPGKAHHVPGTVRHLEDQTSRMSHKLAGSINETPSESPGISGDRYHVIGDVRFEGFIQKQSQHPKLIDNLVGLKFLKRKSLTLKILKGPEHQFITAPVMVSLDQYLRTSRNQN